MKRTPVERLNIAIVIILWALLLLVVFTPIEASDWDYYEPIEIYNIYPTLPGTNIRDYSQPGYHIEIDQYGNREAYSTLPGTDIRDYSQPGYRIDRR